MRRIERLLLVVGVLCLGWVAAVYLFARWDHARQSRELDEWRTRRSASARPAADTALPAPAPAPVKPTPPVTPAKGGVIGKVEVPRLGVSAIVREGVDNSTLRRAVGHVPETALPGEKGNAALAAHRDTFFRPLKNIRTGDRIQVTTPNGVYEYRVAKTQVVDPDNVSVLNPTPDRRLTLITCFPFNYVGSAPQRFIVTATGVSEEADSSGPSAEPAPVPDPPVSASALASIPDATPAVAGKPEPLRRPAAAPVVKKVPSKASAGAKRRSGHAAAKSGRSRTGQAHASASKRPAAERASAKRNPGMWGKLLRVFTPKPPRQGRRPS